METIDKDDILFYISKETLQYEAMGKIGRYLTDEEMAIAKGLPKNNISKLIPFLFWGKRIIPFWV